MRFFLSEEELTILHALMVARQHLLDRVPRLSLAALAYSVLIEDGAMRRLLDASTCRMSSAPAQSQTCARRSKGWKASRPFMSD